MRIRVVHLYRDNAGEFRYRALAFNNRTVGASEEGFKRKSYALKRIAKEYPDAALVDLTG